MNEDFADVVDWVVVRMAFDRCHDAAVVAHTIGGHMDQAVIRNKASIEFDLISLLPPDDASDLLSGDGIWTMTWIGRVSSSHPLNTLAALQEIVEIGQLASAMVDVHQFDNETDDFGVDFPDSPMLAIEVAMSGEPTSNHW